MPHLELFLTSHVLWWVCLIASLAGLAHGLTGFGFPMISTPVVALFTDVKTAVLVTLFPNIVVNVVSIFKGGNWRHSLGRHWAIAGYVAIGTVAGTQFVLIAPPEPLKLLLAAMIVVYLRQDTFRRFDWSKIAAHPQAAGLAFGLLAGFLSGAVNVSVPPLLIYFTSLGLGPAAMTQILNLCFFVGKVTQAATFGGAGEISVAAGMATIPVIAAALGGVLVGNYFQTRMKPELYRGIIRKVLWAMALLLVFQTGYMIAN
jgi:uncharacterized membrane protein YfcA